MGCISIDVETMTSVDISNVESFAVVRIKVFLWSTDNKQQFQIKLNVGLVSLLTWNSQP